MRSFVERVGVAVIVGIISIPSLPVLVNAVSRADVNRFVEKVLATGTPFVITPRLGKHLGFEQEMPVKVLEVAPEASADDVAHGCHVVLNSTGSAKPSSMILMVNRRPEQLSESHYFLLGLDGQVQRAFRSQTKLDASGKVIRGSGVATPLDVKDPEVLKALEREVAFWRKHFAKKRAPAKKP